VSQARIVRAEWSVIEPAAWAASMAARRWAGDGGVMGVILRKVRRDCGGWF
jgi:hypothetical protein